MPRFGSEPKFEPEPGWTGPRSSSKVQVCGWTGPMVRFGVQGMAVFRRTGLNPSEPNFKVPKYHYVNYHFWPIACDFIDRFFRASNLNGALSLLDRIAYCQLTPIKVASCFPFDSAVSQMVGSKYFVLFDPSESRLISLVAPLSSVSNSCSNCLRLSCYPGLRCALWAGIL